MMTLKPIGLLFFALRMSGLPRSQAVILISEYVAARARGITVRAQPGVVHERTTPDDLLRFRVVHAHLTDFRPAFHIDHGDSIVEAVST